jgi:hypothetical protein
MDVTICAHCDALLKSDFTILKYRVELSFGRNPTIPLTFSRNYSAELNLILTKMCFPFSNIKKSIVARSAEGGGCVSEIVRDSIKRSVVSLDPFRSHRLLNARFQTILQGIGGCGRNASVPDLPNVFYRRKYESSKDNYITWTQFRGIHHVRRNMQVREPSRHFRLFPTA